MILEQIDKDLLKMAEESDAILKDIYKKIDDVKDDWDKVNVDVKNTFKDYSSAPFVEPRIPLKVEQMEQASFQLINRKPILATQEELDENHRSHSAKLRVIERIKG